VLLYTTPSHTPKKNRFRIIFELFGRVYKPNELKEIHKHYAEIFKADPACKDVSRFYFGNTYAKIIDLYDGVIYE